jgi:hypothetical protein
LDNRWRSEVQSKIFGGSSSLHNDYSWDPSSCGLGFMLLRVLHSRWERLDLGRIKDGGMLSRKEGGAWEILGGAQH